MHRFRDERTSSKAKHGNERMSIGTFVKAWQWIWTRAISPRKNRAILGDIYCTYNFPSWITTALISLIVFSSILYHPLPSSCLNFGFWENTDQHHVGKFTFIEWINPLANVRLFVAHFPFSIRVVPVIVITETLQTCPMTIPLERFTRSSINSLYVAGCIFDSSTYI